MPGNDSYTKLLIHCNGADTSTSFTDDSYASPTHIISAGGNAQVDTAYKVFGTGSLLLDGTTDNIIVPTHSDFSLGSGDFTTDFRLRLNSTVNQGARFFSFYYGNNYSLQFYMDNGDLRMVFFVNDVQVGNITTTSPYSFSIDTFYHIEFARGGSTPYMFVNGNSQAVTTTTAFGTLPASTTSLYIGSHFDGTNSLNGWMDEIRWSKGICRHTENFTPPSAEYNGVALKKGVPFFFGLD